MAGKDRTTGLNLEELAVEDYTEAKKKIILVEELESESPLIGKLIDEVKTELDGFNKCWLKYLKNNDPDSLAEAAKIALNARILASDALKKARSVDLNKGLKVVKALLVLVFVLFAVYVSSHWYWHLPWFEGNIWWEIVFFSLFGVLTNLTYSAAKHVLMKDFDKWHLGWYWSKIPQAPFVTLAIILILRSVSVEALGIPLDLGEASNEVLVAIAYILGLFSRRAWELIERIKDWLLPVPSSSKDLAGEKQ